MTHLCCEKKVNANCLKDLKGGSTCLNKSSITLLPLCCRLRMPSSRSRDGDSLRRIANSLVSSINKAQTHSMWALDDDWWARVHLCTLSDQQTLHCQTMNARYALRILSLCVVWVRQWWRIAVKAKYQGNTFKMHLFDLIGSRIGWSIKPMHSRSRHCDAIASCAFGRVVTLQTRAGKVLKRRTRAAHVIRLAFGVKRCLLGNTANWCALL